MPTARSTCVFSPKTAPHDTTVPHLLIDSLDKKGTRMSNQLGQAEPTRPLPTAQPDCDGNFRATANLSSTDCKTRAFLKIPSLKVIPVIVVPGIMGTNLCATKDSEKPANIALKPGEAAWRPPNGIPAGIKEAKKWKKRLPPERQQILDADTLDVDTNGDLPTAPLDADLSFDKEVLKARGWGEIYKSSYGVLLSDLEFNLNSVFEADGKRLGLRVRWDQLGRRDRDKWNAPSEKGVTALLTETELKKFAQSHYPVYAVGYNWRQSNAISANRLEKRIDEIIQFWVERKQKCSQVILVTHSMGGLVARACAKRMPTKILGIVHSVMPALGAPVCYRRIACGTEGGGPAADAFAEIAGETQADTTPAMAFAPGPLELLPNNLYPKPWLHASFGKDVGKPVHKLSLPLGNVYDMYRDTSSWYRMIDPALADPAYKFRGPVEVAKKIIESINQAENFHTTLLGNYYHPNTYAFYAADLDHLSFSSCHWNAVGTASAPEAGALVSGTLVSRDVKGVNRNVKFSDGSTIQFSHSTQDGPGDGTVPKESGKGPSNNIKQLFCTRGYDHQGSYADSSMRDLTMLLIVRIALEAK